jgi:hypothetical protein
MRNVGIILIAVFTVTFDVHARAADVPLFAAFKSFCVNTGGGPDAVKPAVEMAGGKQFKPPTSSGATYSMTVASWLVTIDGHKMLVSAGTSHQRHASGRVSDSNSCTINSDANEDGSIAEIQRWVGVPPNSISTADSTYYDYQEQGSARLPLPTDKEAVKSIMAAGHAWTLVVIRPDANSASIHLTHLLGVTQAQ